MFKGLHWLVDPQPDDARRRGGKENVYSLLTTYYLPPSAGIGLTVARDRGVDLAARSARAGAGSSSGSRSTIARRCS